MSYKLDINLNNSALQTILDSINNLPTYQSIFQEGWDACWKVLCPYSTELEYIESTGTQYINTGFNPNYNTRLVLDVDILNMNSFLFGSRHSSSANATSNNFCITYNSSTIVRLDYGGNESTLTVPSVTGRLVVDRNRNVVSYGDTSYTQTPVNATFQSNYPLYLLTVNTAGTIRADGNSSKIYSAKIYDNDVLVRDYMPVLDKNGVACLYDKVSNSLYYNAGTGSFSYPVELSQCTELSYIQSSGTQYIDTRFKPNNNTRAIADAQFIGASSVSSMIVPFGCRGGGKYFELFKASSSNWELTFLYNTSYSQGFTGSANFYNTRRIYEINKNIATVDGTTKSYASATYQTDYSIYLFGTNNAGTGGYGFPMKLYSCKIYDNDVLIRDYVPVLDPSGVPCLYDKVNKALAYNVGSGAFTAGPVIAD